MFTLPTEIVQYILEQLPIGDISSFSKTNSENNLISNDNYLWYKLTNRDHLSYHYDDSVDFKYLYYNYPWYKLVNKDKFVMAFHISINFEAVHKNQTWHQLVCDAYYSECPFDYSIDFKYLYENLAPLYETGLYLRTEISNMDIWKYLCYKYTNGKISITYVRTDHYPYLIHLANNEEQINVLFNILKSSLTQQEISDYCKIKNKLYQQTGLHLAKNAQHCKILLDNVDDPESYCHMLNRGGRTALMHATSGEHALHLLNAVSNKDEYAKCQDNYGLTALHHAVNAEVSAVLLDHVKHKSLYVRNQDLEWRTPLFFVKTVEQAQVLLEANDYHGYICHKDKYLFTVLHKCKGYELTKLLLESVSDPNALCNLKNNIGQTALFYADEGKVRAMFEYVIDIDSFCSHNPEGVTILFANDDVEAIRLILSRIKNPRALCMARDSYNNTPLHHCKSPEIAQIFLDTVMNREQYVQSRNCANETPLHTNSSVEVCKLLLNTVKDKDTYCRSVSMCGYTPLHLTDSQEMMELLLANVTDPDAYKLTRDLRERLAPIVKASDTNLV